MTAARMRPEPGIYGDMIFEKDVTIPVRGGTYVKANVHRPVAEGTYPVLVGWGPYGKDLPMWEAEPLEYRLCEERGPFMVYERFHAPSWVSDGYIVINIDATGIGTSPGYLDPLSIRDLEYFHDAIEWAGVQPWSSGKVASVGLSYHSYASVGVASLNPPHLAAIIPWEVGHDLYREFTYQGGILGNAFADWWWRIWLLRVQHGLGELSPDELAQNRIDFEATIREHPLLDDWWQERIVDVTKIDVPLLTVANWCGHALSLDSHFEIFNRAASDNKWLRVVSGKHVKPMYDVESRVVQKQFLDHFLKGVDNGWQNEPPINLTVRERTGQHWRHETEWPLTGTQWTTLLLDGTTNGLGEPAPADATATFHARPDDALWRVSADYDDYLANLSDETERAGSSVTFTTAPFEEETELTGPLNAKLFVSVDGADDTDLFATVRYLAADGHEVTFDGILDTSVLPVTVGMLRLSHRALDPEKSTTFLPVHTHEREERVTPGEIYEVEVAIRPTSVVIEKGGRLALEIGSRNGAGTFCYLNNDPEDRRMGGEVTIHTGERYPSSLLIPVIPKR